MRKPINYDLFKKLFNIAQGCSVEYMNNMLRKIRTIQTRRYEQELDT